MPQLDAHNLPSRLGLATSPTQLRRDAWNELHRLTDRMVIEHRTGADLAALRARADELVAGLRPFERYWTFPSSASALHIESLLDGHDVVALADVVSNVTSLLNTYGDRASLLPDEEVIDGTGGFDRSTPHYFTLLVADRVAPGVAHNVRAALHALRS